MRKKKKNPERCDERCFECANRFSCRKRVLIGYERLAFGSTADAFRLLQGGDELPDVGELDLFNVAEIKKPKDGAMELKFFDRIKALEQLASVPDNAGDTASSFYEALTKCAERTREVGEDG